MYVNYGDKDFFEHGVLVDSEHSDTVFDILRCEPYSDEEDKYCFAHLCVDIEDSWLDRKAVMDFTGMTEEDFNPILYAIACTDYYSWDNFGASDYGVSYNWQDCDRDTICEELKGYLIASDNLDMSWLEAGDEPEL